MSAELLVQRQQLHRVELIGPARKDQKWQALAGQGHAAADFKVDWDAQQATCPQGHPSQSWIKTLEKGQPRVFIQFSREHCGPCPVRAQCTRMKRRAIKLFPSVPTGEGTGLGLSLSYGIVTQGHGGMLPVAAAEKFPEFLISLPVRLAG